MRKTTLLFLLVLAMLSCNSSEQQNVKHQATAADSCSHIYIYINGEYDLSINPATDSIIIDTVLTRYSKDSLYYGDSLVTLNRLQSQAYTDSLYQIISDMIVHHVYSENSTVSCYAGDYLKVKMIRGTSAVSTEYNSVGNWKNENEQTHRLFHFLAQHQLIN